MAVGATQTVEVTLQMQMRDGAECGASRKVLAPVCSLKGTCCCLLLISSLKGTSHAFWIAALEYGTCTSRKPAASLSCDEQTSAASVRDQQLDILQLIATHYLAHSKLERRLLVSRWLHRQKKLRQAASPQRQQ